MLDSGEQDRAAPFDLLTIERELARSRWNLNFAEAALERAYSAERQEAARLHNRVIISLLVLIFDAYIVAERQSIPETLSLSMLLRFGLITPLTVAYVALDWRGFLRRWNYPILIALLVAPTFLAALQSLWVVSPTAVSNYQAVPLIQLAVLTARVTMRQAIVIQLLSLCLFIATVLHGGFVPSALKASMILTDISVTVSVFMFMWRLDARDRQIFLFTRQAEIGRDILARQNRRLAKMTQADALTGLGNRRCFDDTLTRLWGANGPAAWPITLIMFDIDCFKQFNDSLGHQAGDECLKMVARAVTHCLRDGRDTLVRYGGEEFAIILPSADLAEGRAVAERVRQAIMARAHPHPGGGPSHVVTISLGVACAQDPRQAAAGLVGAADEALYAAKRRGRNCVVCAGESEEGRKQSFFEKKDQKTLTN